MHSLAHTARWTGGAYLALGLFGMAGFLLVRPQLRGTDAAGTLELLVTQSWLAHLGIGLELFTVIAQAATAVGFYALLRHDRPAAAFSVAVFGMANATAILGSAALLTTASAVAADASLAPAGDAAATASLLLTAADGFWAAGAVFFGLWLLPMGWFALSTGRMPRILGWLLLAGGAGYVLSCLIGAAAPGIPSLVIDALTIPATVAEFWMIGYLLIRGIRPAAAREPAALLRERA